MAPEDLLSVCCLVLPLVLSSVVLSPLVSSCLGFSALLSSCVVYWASPGPFLGLSRASLGTHFAPPQGHFGLPGGPWGSWAPPGLPLGRSWPLLGRPGRPLGLLLAALGPLLGRPWPAPGPFWAARGSSWGSFGRSWPALGSQRRFSTKPLKTYIFAWFLRGFGALGWLLGRPKLSWVLSGWPWSRPWPWPRRAQLRVLRRPVRFHCIDYVHVEIGGWGGESGVS